MTADAAAAGGRIGVVTAGKGWNPGSTLFYTEFTDGSPAGGHTTGSLTDLGQAWADICPNAVTP